MHWRTDGLMQSVNAEPATVVVTCVSKRTRDRSFLTTAFITPCVPPGFFDRQTYEFTDSQRGQNGVYRFIGNTPTST